MCHLTSANLNYLGCASNRWLLDLQKEALLTEPALAIRGQKRNAMQNQELSPLQPVHNLKPYKRVEGTRQIERFFRAAAGLDVDKEHLRRYYNFVDQKVADLFLVAQHIAKANDRVRVELRDLPITKGLQESIHAFEALDLDIGLECILERNVSELPSDLPYSDEVDARLPNCGRSKPRSRSHLQDHRSADQASCNRTVGARVSNLRFVAIEPQGIWAALVLARACRHAPTAPVCTTVANLNTPARPQLLLLCA